jgi:hypothetical protein
MIRLRLCVAHADPMVTLHLPTGLEQWCLKQHMLQSGVGGLDERGHPNQLRESALAMLQKAGRMIVRPHFSSGRLLCQLPWNDGTMVEA